MRCIRMALVASSMGLMADMYGMRSEDCGIAEEEVKEAAIDAVRDPAATAEIEVYQGCSNSPDNKTKMIVDEIKRYVIKQISPRRGTPLMQLSAIDCTRYYDWGGDLSGKIKRAGMCVPAYDMVLGVICQLMVDCINLDAKSIDEGDEEGVTALMRANSPEQVRTLCEMGADVNRQEDVLGRTALMQEMTFEVGRRPTSSKIEKIKILIASRADVNVQNKQGETALLRVLGSTQCAEGKASLVQMFLAAKADVNIRDNREETPLFVAIKDPRMVSLLLNAKAEVSSKIGSHGTPLMIASDPNVISMLFRAGADLEICDEQGDTALLRMVKRVDRTKVIYLLLVGASVNARDRQGRNFWDCTHYLCTKKREWQKEQDRADRLASFLGNPDWLFNKRCKAEKERMNKFKDDGFFGEGLESYLGDRTFASLCFDVGSQRRKKAGDDEFDEHVLKPYYERGLLFAGIYEDFQHYFKVWDVGAIIFDYDTGDDNLDKDNLRAYYLQRRARDRFVLEK